MNTRRVVLTIIAAAFLLAGCTQPTGTLRPLAAPKPTEGIVIYVAGDVEALTGTSSIAVEPGDRVGAGTTIITKADSYCELQFGGTISVRVEPKTQFRCGSVAIGDTTAAVSGTLTAGAILAKVKKLTGSGLQVQTPAAVVGVRGTAFKVSVSGEVTAVTVSEGTVNVARDGTTVDVGEGQRAEAAPGAEIIPEPARAEDLEAIDAFEQLSVDTSDVKQMFKSLMVVTDPPNAEIILKRGETVIRIGRGTLGSVIVEGADFSVELRSDGYETVIFRGADIRGRVPPKKLKRSSASREPSTPEPPSPTPSPGPSSTPAQSRSPAPATAPSPATSSMLGAEFRVDPAIDNDPFFQWAAKEFAKQAPGFALSPGRGDAEITIGIGDRTSLNYELLPQVAAKRLLPLNDWTEWQQLVPVLVEAVSVGGRKYGIPIGGSSPILYFNKDFVRGDPPRSFQEIMDFRQAVATEEVEALAMATGDPVTMGMFLESRDESRAIHLIIPDTGKSSLGNAAAAMAYDALQDELRNVGLPIGVTQEAAFGRFRNRKAAMLIDGPGSFEKLRDALGGALGVATLPSWGRPPRELAPYTEVLALFVSNTVNEKRAEVLKRFCGFLLGEECQLKLCRVKLQAGTPIAPSLNFLGSGTVKWNREELIISVLHDQLKNAVAMPQGLPARDAVWAFGEVLANLEHQGLGEGLAEMAGARFLLYGIKRKPMPAGGSELRAVIDPAAKSQGLFFVPEYPGEEASDLRLIRLGGSIGVVSAVNVPTFANRGEKSMVYLVVNHGPYRAGTAPRLRGTIEYFDEPNAELRIVYDSRDRTVRKDPQDPDTWGAWKEAIVIQCRGEKTWKQVQFMIPDAQFDGRCNDSDICIEVLAHGKKPAIRSVILTPAK